MQKLIQEKNKLSLNIYYGNGQSNKLEKKHKKFNNIKGVTANNEDLIIGAIKWGQNQNPTNYFDGYLDELWMIDDTAKKKDLKKLYIANKHHKDLDENGNEVDRKCECECNENNETNTQNQKYNAVSWIKGSQCNAGNDWNNGLKTQIASKKVEFYFYKDANCNNKINSKIICSDSGIKCGNTDNNGCLKLSDNNITKTYRCVKVHIIGQSINYTESETNESNSSDGFSVRPNKFKIYNNNKINKSANEFNLTITAQDYNDKNLSDFNYSYNKNGLKIENIKDNKSCKVYELNITKDINFINGEANITLKYSDVGDLNFTLKEVNRSEFAYVDQNDTNDNDRLIKGSTSHIKIVPYTFDINESFSDYDKDNNFTYYDRDLNISVLLELNISAVNKDGEITKNYNKECYAKDIDVNITHSKIDVNVSKILYKIEDMSGNIKDKNVSIDENISFLYSKDNFTTDNNGSTNVKVYINFDRNRSNPVNPLEFNITQIDVNDSDVNGTANTNKSSHFYYGNLHLSDIIATENDFDQNYYFIAYDENNTLKTKEIIYNWHENPKHQSIDGNVSNDDIVVSSDYNASNTVNGVDISVDSIKDGIITFKISRTDSDVTFAVIHLLSPNLKWLWYSKFNQIYDISNDSTCLNHFCFTITWQNINEAGEVGSGKFKGTEANVTETNSTKRGVKIFR